MKGGEAGTKERVGVGRVDESEMKGSTGSRSADVHTVWGAGGASDAAALTLLPVGRGVWVRNDEGADQRSGSKVGYVWVSCRILRKQGRAVPRRTGMLTVVRAVPSRAGSQAYQSPVSRRASAIPIKQDFRSLGWEDIS